MTKITKETVLDYARKAKLTISDDEINYFIEAMVRLDKQAELLAEADTIGVEPDYFGNTVYTELEEDDKKLVKNVTEPRLQYIDVPMMSEIGEEDNDRL